MGLHQKITDQNTAEPCDCGADDDHAAVLMNNPDAIQAMVDEGSDSATEAQQTAVDDYRNIAFQEPVWTDGNE
jgi:hypothetical protein